MRIVELPGITAGRFHSTSDLQQNSPSFVNLTIRLLPPRCPSVTQMSPFGAMTTPDGPLKCFGPYPETAASPMVIITSPSWLSLKTWCPMPRRIPSTSRRSPAGAPSVTQRYPSSSR